MTKTEWMSHRAILKGIETKPISSPILMAKYGSRVFTPAQYAASYLGRRTVNAETAFAAKIERAGWSYADGTNRYHRFSKI
jgi:hypothetical protein